MGPGPDGHRVWAAGLVTLALLGGPACRRAPELPQAAAGFEVGLFAQEPLVRQVSALAFDRRGRLFAGGGPQYRRPGPETEGDRVWLLVDEDGDGVAEEARTFASGFNSIQGLAWKGDDLWIANAPDLTVVRDRDGDDEADEYVLVYTGVGTLEHGLHGLAWAPDGKLYMSKGDTPVVAEAPRAFRELAEVAGAPGSPDEQPLRTFGKDDFQKTYLVPEDGHTVGGILRADAMGKNLEIVSRGLRNPWDIAFDDGFDWLGTDNDDSGGDRLVMPFFGAHFGSRHPWSNDWTGEGHLPTVPISGPMFEGSGVGIVYYDAGQFPESHRGVFLIGDWLLKKVYVYHPAWDGALMQEREGALDELLSAGEARTLGESSGTPFSPTDLAVGPDGALYVGGWGDTYGWVDGAKGRVFRVHYVAHPLIDRSEWSPTASGRSLRDLSVGELLGDLGRHVDVWRVDAQEELVRRGPSVTSALLQALESGELTKQQETWAVWALGRIGSDDGDIDGWLAARAADGDPERLNLRLQALRVLAHRAGLADDPRPLPDAVDQALRDPEPRVRFAAVHAVWQARDVERAGRFPDALAREDDRVTWYSLWRAAQELVPAETRTRWLEDERPTVRLAALLGLLEERGLAGDRVVALGDDPDPQVSQYASSWVGKAGYGIADPGRLLDLLLSKRTQNRHIQYRLRVDLLKSLARLDLEAQDWERLHDQYWTPFHPEVPTNEIVPVEKSEEIVMALRAMAAAPDRVDETLEIFWIALTGHGWRQVREGVAGEFFRLGTPARLRLLDGLEGLDGESLALAISALADFGEEAGPWDPTPVRVAALARGYELSSGGHVLRRKIVELLLQADPSSLKTGATAGGAEAIAREAAFSPDPRVRELVGPLAQVLGVTIEVQPPPAFGIDDVVPLVAVGDSARGRDLFYREDKGRCFLCHAVGSRGGDFAPELSSLAERYDARSLVEAILIPSAQITQGYGATRLVTRDGRHFFGAVRGETDRELTIVETDGRPVELAIEDIARRKRVELSPMPDIFGQVLSPEEVADITAWLLRQDGDGSSSSLNP